MTSSTPQISKSAIMSALELVIDPEMYISIVDLGLIYDVAITDKGAIDITMTLTTIGCPLFPVIERDIHDRVGEIAGVTGVTVHVVFDPPWSVDLMTEKGRAILGV